VKIFCRVNPEMMPLIRLSFFPNSILGALFCSCSLLFIQYGWAGAEQNGARQNDKFEIFFEEVYTNRTKGEKQLLIFVHGTPGSASGFRGYLADENLRARFHMISVTRPGWVDPDSEKVPSLDHQAAALEPLLKRDTSGRGAILMGHSYGGPVIARTAMDYPDLVGGLVFVASTGDPDLSGPRWYNRFAVILPKFLLGAQLKGANQEIMPLKAQLEDMLPRWKNIKLPVLIVQGDKDKLVDPNNALFLREQLVNSKVTYLHREGAGHFVLWEQSDLISNTILEIF